MSQSGDEVSETRTTSSSSHDNADDNSDDNLDGVGRLGTSNPREADMMKRRCFFNDLLAATSEDHSVGSGTFATSGPIVPEAGGQVLHSLTVQGAGDLPLPLSKTGVAKLRSVCEKAPHGQGANTVLDPAVRKAWQVDASKVSFPGNPHFLRTVQHIATKAAQVLGLDTKMVQVEAHLYKLLLYEVGGHFKFHRDTEKEPGMFGSLIVQLPTEGGFEGGALVVNHGKSNMVFDYSKESSRGFFYTSFFADCRHSLQKVKAGTRLCLAFNLVRSIREVSGGAAQIGRWILESPMLEKVETVLRPWLDVVAEPEGAREGVGKNTRFFPAKLAIPLQHKYTPANLSFSGLKGVDQILAHVLKNCRDRDGNTCLDLHLCLLTKVEMGYPTEDDDEYGLKYRKAWSERHSCFNTEMEEVCDRMYKVGTWVGEGDQKCLIRPHLDIATEVVLRRDEEGLFEKKEDPDEFEYGPYTGNEGPSLEYFYHKALIVFWPKKKTVQTMFDAAARKHGDSDENLEFLLRAWHELRVFFPPGCCAVISVLRILNQMQKQDHAYVYIMMNQLLTHCESKGQEIWTSAHDFDPKVEGMDGTIGSILLDMCCAEGGLPDVLRVLELFRRRFYSGTISRKPSWCIGIRNAFVSTAIAKAVHRHGWSACGAAVLRLLQEDCILQQGDNFAQLAMKLRQIGCHNEAVLVATKIFDLVTSSGCSPRIVIDMVSNFFQLGDEGLFQGLVQTLLQQVILHKQQHVVKELLHSDSFRSVLVESAPGRDALKALSEERLKWLALSDQKPEFSWCQPLAQLPHHPRVEAFLRGPEEHFIYTSFNSLPDARKFVHQYLNGCYSNGYCATGTEHGRGAQAHCVIKKSRTAFNYVLENWKEERKEVETLKLQIEELEKWSDGGAGRKRKKRASD
ncbi:hypothetical protein M758_4G090300 [Ceratodon purpureus]|nr:hypothetical protein M758_4G090300 [Ceratodon purpureus]KAG0618762.1 hypothetical protein M758_4G090300 [Ceratodon purpureus]